MECRRLHCIDPFRFMEADMSTTRDAVHEHYRSAALRIAGQAPGCCGDEAGCGAEAGCGPAYRAEAAAGGVRISNCVTNRAEEKGAVIREAFRVLRPGGRLAVSDMVELRPLPEAVKRDLDAVAHCIAGTIPVDDYRRLLVEAGFESPEIQVTGEQGVAGPPRAIGSASLPAPQPAPRGRG